MLKEKHAKALFTTFLAMSILLTTGCASMLGKPKVDYADPVSGMEFVFIKGGTFQMGDAADQSPRETPVHLVTLGDFAVGIYEVTFAEYDMFCEETGRKKPSDEDWGRGNRPVINVNWDDASAYARWLSSRSGLDFSLPTEAQWEYFARAGTTTRFWTGEKLPKNRANCRECGSEFDNRMTAPIGTFRPNHWGVYDTAGNVAEWTQDDWHNGYESAPTDGSTRLEEATGEKVYRGGAWNYPVNELETATRDWASKDDAFNTVGFRLVINNFSLPQAK